MPKDAIDFEDVKTAVDEVKKSWESFKETHDEQLKEATKKYVDPLLEEKLTKINADLDEKQAKIDELYAASRRKTIILDGKQIDEEELDAKAFAWADTLARRRGSRAEEYSSDELKTYQKAFERYLRKDDRVLTADEQKALSVGSDPDGGYVVHPDMSGRIARRVFETSPIRSYASVQVISTDALEGIHDNDEASSGWVSETGSRTETGTPQLDVWRIPVHEQYAEPRATQKLLDDAAIDMEGWLSDKVADKLVRTENTAFVAGDGVGKPRGITTYGDWASAGVFEMGAIEQFDTGANGDFAADPNGGDVFLDAIYGLKDVYRQNGVFFTNRATTGRTRKLRDGDNNYLWQTSFQAGEPARILGYPVVGFEDMPAYTGTGALAIAFGDMSEAYQIVDRMGIRVLRDPYTAKPFVKLYTTKRVGGDVVNFEALKLIAFQA